MVISSDWPRHWGGASLRQWLNRPQDELYAALPGCFIADWDSMVNTRYGQQEEAVQSQTMPAGSWNAVT